MSDTRAAVLVTGASGFIGGRLAERLAREDGVRTVGSGRKFTDEATLRAAGVELAQADLRDQAAMARLCEGKQVVYHVAAWLMRGQRSDADAYDVNVTATRALAQAAARAGVRRLVLVSSVATYGLPQQDEVDENAPLRLDQPDVYGRTKAQGEVAAQEVAQATGMELAIVRPAMVYGPRSAGWTVGMLKLVQKGVPVIFGKADGNAFPVYVDDVVDMLRLAGTRREAAGQAFNASDAPIPWAEFFGYYARMSGRKPRRLPMALAQVFAVANERLHLGLPLTRERLSYYVRHLRFSTAKAERLLSWRVSVPMAEGMRRSEEWLRQAGYLRS